MTSRLDAAFTPADVLRYAFHRAGYVSAHSYGDKNSLAAFASALNQTKDITDLPTGKLARSMMEDPYSDILIKRLPDGRLSSAFFVNERGEVVKTYEAYHRCFTIKTAGKIGASGINLKLVVNDISPEDYPRYDASLLEDIPAFKDCVKQLKSSLSNRIDILTVQPPTGRKGCFSRLLRRFVAG